MLIRDEAEKHTRYPAPKSSAWTERATEKPGTAEFRREYMCEPMPERTYAPRPLPDPGKSPVRTAFDRASDEFLREMSRRRR